MSYTTSCDCPDHRIDANMTADAINDLQKDNLDLWLASDTAIHVAILQTEVENPDLVRDNLPCPMCH